MEYESIKDQFGNKNSRELSELKDILENYIGYYKWILISMLLCVSITFFYARKQTPKYNIKASVLIKDAEKGNSFADLTAFESLGLIGNGDNSLENEIQILRSRRLITKVVKELGLNVQYFIEHSPYNLEVFPDFPVTISLSNDSLGNDFIYTDLTIIIRSKKIFDIVDFDGNTLKNKSFDKEFQFELGNEDASLRRLISLTLNDSYKEELIGKKILVSIRPINSIVTFYLDNISIEPINDKLSNVLSISIDETLRLKGIALLNNLIEQYNADGINDKNLLSQYTTQFLDERLELLSTEINAIEATAEQFKTSKRIVDIDAGSEYFLESSSNNEKELVAANTQLQLIDYMFEELNKSGTSELLPVNVGITDPGIVSLIGEFNELVLKRNRIIKSSSDRNPIIVGIDSQLDILNNNLISSLKNTRSSLEIRLTALNNQTGAINSRLASVPKNEREYKDIVRQQETKDALYLFLLQKREESILSNAVNVSKAKILDEAFSLDLPVSPKKGIIFFGALLFGLVVPIVVIYLKDILDTRIHTDKDLRALNIPYIGDIPLQNSGKSTYISKNDNSKVAEAFRYIRTNVKFMLDEDDKCKTIFVTSTKSNEGKTFVSINLAHSLAISGKKTLLLGLDLRAPKIITALGMDAGPGVTNFIKDSKVGLRDLLHQHPFIKDLDVVHSGDIPPNPGELLTNHKVEELFRKYKDEYEYIIVDTAPVGLVTDTIQIGKIADLTIYVVKANYLDKRMLYIPKGLHDEKKLLNMAFLLNSTDHSKPGYGYGYGYGKKEKMPWYRKMYKKDMSSHK